MVYCLNKLEADCVDERKLNLPSRDVKRTFFCDSGVNIYKKEFYQLIGVVPDCFNLAIVFCRHMSVYPCACLEHEVSVGRSELSTNFKNSVTRYLRHCSVNKHSVDQIVEPTEYFVISSLKIVHSSFSIHFLQNMILSRNNTMT